MSRVMHWPPSALLGAFMAGLKPEIVVELMMWRRCDLQEAIELAMKKYEHLHMSRAKSMPTRSVLGTLAV